VTASERIEFERCGSVRVRTVVMGDVAGKPTFPITLYDIPKPELSLKIRG
jgi:hypothetical protein